jgi:hypothetical protein
MTWIEENSVAYDGLSKSIQLVQALAAKLSDTRIDEDSIVAISLKIDYLLIALTALAEANFSTTIDDGLSELFDQEESRGSEDL